MFSMGKRSTFDYRKDRRRERKKQKKEVIVRNNIVRKSWDSHKSVKANFDRIGLLFDPNADIHKSGSDVEKSVFERETKTVKELKSVKRTKKKRGKFISEGDRMFCMYMLELYGEDYQAMCVDSKNVYQLTPAQIKNLIHTFRKSRHFHQYLVDKKNNNLHDLEFCD